MARSWTLPFRSRTRRSDGGKLRKPIDRHLLLTLPAGDALEALDIGCGTGFLSLELALRGHLAIGVDFAPSMIAQARKERRMEEEGLERRIRRR